MTYAIDELYLPLPRLTILCEANMSNSKTKSDAVSLVYEAA